MRRFFTGVTPAATTLLGLFGSGLLALEPLLLEKSIALIVPAGTQLAFRGETDIHLFRALAMFTLALIPGLGWLLAAIAAARRQVRSGVSVALLYTTPIFLVAAAAGVFRLLVLRALLREEHSIVPMISLGGLDHWTIAMLGALVSAAVLLAHAWRRAR